MNTATTGQLQQFYTEQAPPLVTDIPSSVATTFTGTSQAAVVSAWLDQESSGVSVPLGTIVVTIFPDGSNADYSVTATNPTTYSFVSGSGHDSEGAPESDSGAVLTATLYTQLTSPLTFGLKNDLPIIQRDEKVEEVTIGPKKINYHGADIQALCVGGSGGVCSGTFGLGDWQFLLATLG